MTHPANQQFERELKARTVTSQKKEEFRKFRDKQPAGSEDRAEADCLWAECERLGDVEIGKNRPLQKMVQSKSSTARPGGRDQEQRGGGSRQRPPRRGGHGLGRGGDTPPRREDTNNAGGADPSVLGQPFHNPYTFLPFPPGTWFSGRRERRLPTPLTQDEIELSRFTGIVDVELVTLSPLLTSDPKKVSEHDGHKSFQLLAIGDDIVVPATGVRGSLRTLMTIVAGGTLGYLDESAWLVQGRDLPLGPAGKTSLPSVPRRCFLARVVRPGTGTRNGTVRLGRTRLVRLECLERIRVPLPRPRPGERIRHLWVNDDMTSVSDKRDQQHPWQLKLSGRPVNSKGKREGLFLDDGPEVTLESQLWRAYMGRNRHGDRPELEPGDLVWLEAKDGATEIESENDIASIQWARWGRRGESLEQMIRRHHGSLLPDSFNPDGKVDEVTDLFGQVPIDRKDKKGAAGPFAARVRPDNLVFRDAAKDGLDRGVALAPLAPPHPDCAAFYRDETDPDRVTNAGKPLRGYKIYRTTSERKEIAPWLFDVQGVYGNDGKLKKATQTVNKTCDLLEEGRVGTVRISCRSLSKRELGLLLLACSVDWRVGGGKPLGLGHCRVRQVIVRDETGKEVAQMQREGDAPAELPQPYAAEISDLLERRNLWHQSQLPVAMLRYPRAVTENKNGKSRGGHAWFARHASPKKSAEPDRPPVGLEVLWTMDKLEARAGKNRIKAQPLPRFDAESPSSGVLYGHDLFAGDGPAWSEQGPDRRTYYKKLEPFDEEKHARPFDKSGGNHGQSRKTSQDDRSQRRKR